MPSSDGLLLVTTLQDVLSWVRTPEDWRTRGPKSDCGDSIRCSRTLYRPPLLIAADGSLSDDEAR